MPSAARAAVTAEYLQMALLTSQFSFCTTQFPQITNQQAVRETHKVCSLAV